MIAVAINNPPTEVDEYKTYVIPMVKKANRMLLSRPLLDTDIERQLFVRPILVMDGAMVEFFDPTSGESVGSCGIHFWGKYALPARALV